MLIPLLITLVIGWSICQFFRQFYRDEILYLAWGLLTGVIAGALIYSLNPYSV